MRLPRVRFTLRRLMIFIAIIGWVLFFFLFRAESQIDPDATAERGGIDAEPTPSANGRDEKDDDA